MSLWQMILIPLGDTKCDNSYVVPTVLTLAVKPSFELTGFGRCDGQDDLERRGGEWEVHNGSQHERELKKPKKNSKKR